MCVRHEKLLRGKMVSMGSPKVAAWKTKLLSLYKMDTLTDRSPPVIQDKWFPLVALFALPNSETQL